MKSPRAVAPGATVRGLSFCRWCSLRSETAWLRAVGRLWRLVVRARPLARIACLAGSGCDTGGLAALPPAPTPSSTATSAATSPPASAPDATARSERTGSARVSRRTSQTDWLRADGDRNARCPPGRGALGKVHRSANLDERPDRPAPREAHRDRRCRICRRWAGRGHDELQRPRSPRRRRTFSGRSPPVRVDVSASAGVDVQRGMSAERTGSFSPERYALSGGTSGRAPCGTV
jgi:hypothetical protein